MTSDHTLNDLTAEATFAEISNRNPAASKLLTSIGIPLPEKRAETVRSFCQDRQWREEELLQWIKTQCAIIEDKISGDEAVSDHDRSLSEWFDYLRNHFISPNRALLDGMEERFKNKRKIRSFENGKATQIVEAFQKLSEGVALYYRFEEQKLFPLAEKLLSSKASNLRHGVVQNIGRSFDIMKRDQQRLERISKNTRNMMKNMKDKSAEGSSFIIQNESMGILCNSLSEQFKKEKAYFIPRIKEEINTRK